MPIKRSSRLDQVTREFYGYSDRRLFFRLDRNEDPVGWEDSKFAELKKSLIQEDFAAYSDSNELLSKLSEWTSLPEENIYITAGADGAIKNIFEDSGAVAKISSIHVNGWFGDYDKLSTCQLFVSSELGFELSEQREKFIFVGDMR